MDNDKLYLEHILEAIVKIEKFTANFTFREDLVSLEQELQK